MSFIPKEQYQQMLEQLPIVCVDVLIMFQGKCLLLLRENEPAKNTYWFPGGRIYKNESIVNAALRKAKEETNLDCSFERIVSVEETIFEKTNAMLTVVHTINVCCLLNVEEINTINLDSLHSHSKWIGKLDESFHQAVKHPLSLLGFTY